MTIRIEINGLGRIGHGLRTPVALLHAPVHQHGHAIVVCQLTGKGPAGNVLSALSRPYAQPM
jgi:hypothetical protein